MAKRGSKKDEPVDVEPVEEATNDAPYDDDGDGDDAYGDDEYSDAYSDEYSDDSDDEYGDDSGDEDVAAANHERLVAAGFDADRVGWTPLDPPGAFDVACDLDVVARPYGVLLADDAHSGGQRGLFWFATPGDALAFLTMCEPMYSMGADETCEDFASLVDDWVSAGGPTADLSALQRFSDDERCPWTGHVDDLRVGESPAAKELYESYKEHAAENYADSCTEGSASAAPYAHPTRLSDDDLVEMIDYILAR